MTDARLPRLLIPATTLVSLLAMLGEAVVLLVDDRAARALPVQAARDEGLDADLMATETFLAWLEQDYGVVESATAWQAIRLAAGGNEPAAPAAPVSDPIHIRAAL